MSILTMNEYSTIMPASAESKSVTKLLVGKEVFDLLSDDSFKEAWRDLYNACPWATAFQSWEFVSSWYQVFSRDYLPVLVRSDKGDQLDGLLTMAIPTSGTNSQELYHKQVTIVGAGEYEAEYQCWLSQSANGEAFIKAALSELLKHFPQGKILFRFIPPSAPMDWVETDQLWKSICVRQSFTRPLLELNTPEAQNAFRINNQYKTKLNRLKRLGDVRFEKITCLKEFEQALHDISLQFDFRQGGMFNKNQFREKPARIRFMLELFQKGVLHVTVLKVEDELIASMVAVAGKNWVHLQGVNTHSPFYARHSPGILHFLNLGKLLAEEGAAVFDLTPGGDSYKEKMATTHDTVYGLVVTNNLVYRTKRYLKKQIHSRLIKAGKRPMAVELELEKRLYLFKKRMKKFKEAGTGSLLSSWVRKIGAKKYDKIFTKEINQVQATPHLPIRKNDLSHMLDFDSKGALLTRWEFLENAMRLYETGHHSYTWSQNGRLMACAWVGHLPSATIQPGDRQFIVPENAMVIKMLYYHPEGFAELPAFLDALTAALAPEAETDNFYAVLQDDDHKLCEVLSAVGFTAEVL